MTGDALDVDALGFLGIPLDEARGIIDLTTGFGKRLALFQRHDEREIFADLLHEFVPLAQDR